jgi:hypothetical protein
MKVKELIKKLEELPEDATIGTFETDDMSVNDYVSIYNKTDKVFSYNRETSIREIEEARFSNQSRICDYYIGF